MRPVAAANPDAADVQLQPQPNVHQGPVGGQQAQQNYHGQGPAQHQNFNDQAQRSSSTVSRITVKA